MKKDKNRIIKVLLVEDNPGDVEITRKAFMKSKFTINLQVVEDGENALNFLFKNNNYSDAETPDIILLDLNLPNIDGFEVLETIKNNEATKIIPVVVLTTSDSTDDVLKAYKKYANCFISKPLNFNKMKKIVKSIEDFWFTIVRIPK